MILDFPATKLSSYRRIGCTLAQVSFRLIERRAADRNGAVFRSRLLFTAHKSNMSAFVGPHAVMTFGKASPRRAAICWRVG